MRSVSLYCLIIYLYSLAYHSGPGDRRTGRLNHVIFDVSPFQHDIRKVRWLCTGLETIAIVVFGCTTAGYGLNTRIADPESRWEGYTLT